MTLSLGITCDNVSMALGNNEPLGVAAQTTMIGSVSHNGVGETFGWKIVEMRAEKRESASGMGKTIS